MGYFPWFCLAVAKVERGTDPPRPAVTTPVTIYHALPYGLRDPLRRPVTAAVVPEITLTWDAGVADAVTRRLLLPPYPPEH